MIKEFSLSPNYYNVQTNSKIKKTLLFLQGKINSRVLDIGQRSPLSAAIAEHFNVVVDNTNCDLDVSFDVSGAYDIVIYSHTIEHQFNPLFTLLNIHKVLNDNGRLYLMLPARTKLLWCKGHYHEIDNYRLRLLLKRAGFKVIDRDLHKVWRYWKEYLKGIRPILRFFLEFNAVYTIEKL